MKHLAAVCLQAKPFKAKRNETKRTCRHCPNSKALTTASSMPKHQDIQDKREFSTPKHVHRRATLGQSRTHHSRLGQHRVLSTKRCQRIGWQKNGGHLASSSLPLRRATAEGVATATCEKQPWSPQLHLTPGLPPACHNTGRPPCFRLLLHRRATA